ncbi:MAG: hypothetical protein ABI837_09125 [Acidobacteriota bacterium]
MMSVVALLALAAAAPQRQSVTFVVSPRSSLRNLSAGELRRIFLGRTSRWPNRRRVVVCLRPTDSPEGAIMLERVARMSEIDYSQNWLGAVFRGDVSSVPRIYGSRDALIKTVAGDEDAIGFVLTSEKAVTPARSITIDGKAPDDASYPVAH